MICGIERMVRMSTNMSTNMITKRALYLARMRGYVPRTWRGWALVACGALYLVALVASLSSQDTGATIVLVVNGALAVTNWRAYTSWTHWRQRGTWARVGIVTLYLLGWVVPVIVFWTAARDARISVRAEIAQRTARIAALERELGLDGPHSAQRGRDA
jgi:hypothetical protein